MKPAHQGFAVGILGTAIPMLVGLALFGAIGQVIGLLIGIVVVLGFLVWARMQV